MGLLKKDRRGAMETRVERALKDGIKRRLEYARRDPNLPGEILEKLERECELMLTTAGYVGYKCVLAEVQAIGQTIRRLHGLRLPLAELVAFVVVCMSVVIEKIEREANADAAKKKKN